MPKRSWSTARGLGGVALGMMCALAVLAQSLIVEAAAQVPRREATWRVAERPELTIGRVDGAEEYLLTWVVEAALLGNGGMVLQNSARGLFELRFFDARGQHLATTSRWGQGPYEFHYSRALSRLPGDSVLVIGDDWRYAVFGSRGERVREGRIPGPVPAGFEFRYHPIDAVHFGGENSLLLDRRAGPVRGRRALIVRNFTGASDTVAILNSERAYFDPSGRLGREYAAPFSPGVFSAASPGVYWFGSTDVPEVYGYRVNGQGMDTIRLNWAPTPVTRADRERWSDEVLDPSDLRGAELMGFPDSFPYWGALEVDHAGNVWVLRYEVPWAEGPQRWGVFSPLGEPIATVTFPRAIAPRCTAIGCRTLLDIGLDHVLLIRRGPLDVPQVHLHRLIKE